MPSTSPSTPMGALPRSSTARWTRPSPSSSRAPSSSTSPRSAPPLPLPLPPISPSRCPPAPLHAGVARQVPLGAAARRAQRALGGDAVADVADERARPDDRPVHVLQAHRLAHPRAEPGSCSHAALGTTPLPLAETAPRSQTVPRVRRCNSRSIGSSASRTDCSTCSRPDSKAPARPDPAPSHARPAPPPSRVRTGLPVRRGPRRVHSR